MKKYQKCRHIINKEEIFEKIRKLKSQYNIES